MNMATPTPNLAQLQPTQLLDQNEIWAQLMAARQQPKSAIRKLCLKLQKRTYPRVAMGILHRILNSRDPAREILVAKDDELTLARIMQEFDEAGYVGMIIVGDVITPLILDLTPKTFTTYKLVTHDGNVEGEPWDPAKFETYWLPDQVTVDEGEPDDLAWCIENEYAFALECGRATMVNLGFSLLHCTVVLSRKFGFSNRPHDLPICIDQSGKKKRT